MGNAQGGGGKGGANEQISSTWGWRILKVNTNSPCAHCGLVPYFDVLTHVNGVRLGDDKSEKQLYHLIADKEGAPTTFSVFNYVSKKWRDVSVTPNRAWGGKGLIGLVIRYDNFANADLDTFHVLDIFPGSPAEKAGFQAHADYLLGTADICFKGNDELDLFISRHDGVAAQVAVYNAKTAKVRECTITVNSKWAANKGALGCDVGYGVLHRLPLRDVTEVTVDGAIVDPATQLGPTPASVLGAAAPAPATAAPQSAPQHQRMPSGSPAVATTAGGATPPQSSRVAFPDPQLFAIAGGFVLRLNIATADSTRPLNVDLRIALPTPSAAPVAAVAPTPTPAVVYTAPAVVPVVAAVAPVVAVVPAPAPAVDDAAAPTAAYTAASKPIVVTPPVQAQPQPVVVVAQPTPAPAPAVVQAVTPAPAPAAAVAPAPAPAAAAVATTPIKPFVAGAATTASPFAAGSPAGGVAPFAAFKPAAFSPAPFTPAPFTPAPFKPFEFKPFNPAAFNPAALGGAAGTAPGASPFASFAASFPSTLNAGATASPAAATAPAPAAADK